MTDVLLTTRDRKEALSIAYVQTVAAVAGYATRIQNFDRSGIDLQICAGGEVHPAVDMQLKSTVNLGVPTNGYYNYRLRVHNYNLLCIKTQTPRLLVVLDLPEDEDQWLTITTGELILRRCAYWLSLVGEAETDNQSSVTVRIPVDNVFDVQNLRLIMDRSREGSF